MELEIPPIALEAPEAAEEREAWAPEALEEAPPPMVTPEVAEVKEAPAPVAVADPLYCQLRSTPRNRRSLRGGREGGSANGGTVLTASLLELANELLSLLEVSRRCAGDVLDDTVETSDKRVEAVFVSWCPCCQPAVRREDSLGLVTDGQTGGLVTRETGVVDWQG
jgi:hypothetical protein